MTDNFELLKRYICKREEDIVNDLSDTSWNSEREFDKNIDKYYVVEIMRRGKDNPNLPAANVHFKNYYINKVSDLDKYKDEIKLLCDQLRMRAYFSVNWKSYKQVLMDTAAECSRRVATHDYKKPYSIYESCSGKFCGDKNKTWIIDVDKEDAEEQKCTINSLTEYYRGVVEEACKPYSKIIGIIPTRSGNHIICRPFDVVEFNRVITNAGFKPHDEKKHEIIKKNHLTLLYENL